MRQEGQRLSKKSEGPRGCCRTSWLFPSTGAAAPCPIDGETGKSRICPYATVGEEDGFNADEEDDDDDDDEEDDEDDDDGMKELLGT
jgi:hypothetical protein